MSIHPRLIDGGPALTKLEQLRAEKLSRLMAIRNQLRVNKFLAVVTVCGNCLHDIKPHHHGSCEEITERARVLVINEKGGTVVSGPGQWAWLECGCSDFTAIKQGRYTRPLTDTEHETLTWEADKLSRELRV